MYKLSIRKGPILWVSAVLISLSSFSQPRSDSSRTGGRSGSGPKPYAEVITAKAVSDPGLFLVHKVEDKYFFEVPDSLMNRHILVVNRISKAAAGMRTGGFFGYAGDYIGQNVIRFERGPNNRVFLRTHSFAEYTKDSSSPMFMAVNNSNIQPIAASFEIKAFSKDSSAVVIDVTDYIGGDNDVMHFSGPLKSSLRLSSLQADKSYIAGVKSFPINVEIKTVKTYGRASGGFGSATGPATVTGGNLTVELNTSMVLLPAKPMRPRYFDPRVGYFATGYTDYDLNPQGVESVVMVQRWRLEPKEGDMEKYKRGELVEPKKPIVFYIDPATPKKWAPYLIQGVNDWQLAFEKAGFKNAIMAKMAPTKEEDSTWSLEDARNSAIVYKPSDIPNASGPRIWDPRSGEIMESHINWYHNVMELLRDWYFVQCSPVDPRARKMIFDDELMGQLIRFVSSHEVGHTIGLRHNYGSSSSVPVEKLRDKAWVEANGHTPSIMDYARFNYVAQPEDNIGEKGLFPRIGDYDKWAIEWAYTLFPDYPDPEAEKEKLNKWVIEKLKDPRLWFGTETNPDDPRSQREQVGDDAMKGSMYGIRNLQRILPNLLEWTKLPNKDYDNLAHMYNAVSSQFNRYMGHVAKYVGGIKETPKTVEQVGPVYEIVSKAEQKQAVDFLNKNLFTTPTWLINEEIFGRTGQSGLVVVGGVQDNILGQLFNVRTLNKLAETEALNGDYYDLREFFTDIKRGVWTELSSRKPIDVFRRNLQKAYVNILSNVLNPAPATQSTGSFGVTLTITTPGGDKSDVKSAVRAHLTGLRSEINAAAAGTADQMTRFHLQDLSARISKALDPK